MNVAQALVNSPGFTSQETSLLIDSGAASHMCNDCSLFKKLKRSIREIVEVGEGNHVAAHGQVDIHVTNIVFGEKIPVNLREVQFVQDSYFNLLAVSFKRKKGLFITSESNERSSYGTGTVRYPQMNEVCLVKIESKRTGLYVVLIKPSGAHM